MAGAFTPLDGGRTVNMPVVSAAVVQGDPLKLGTAGVQLADNGSTLFGVAMSAGAVGDVIAVWRGPGRCKATADTTDFAIGDRVYMEASSKLGAGAATEKSAGQVVDANPAASGTVIFDFDPFGTFAHA